ncbi:MAG: hypothetical protein CMB79_01870 [Filomicrobium sp.]|nr:hypothetical protein [Filomicrobium sp.]
MIIADMMIAASFSDAAHMSGVMRARISSCQPPINLYCVTIRIAENGDQHGADIGALSKHAIKKGYRPC